MLDLNSLIPRSSGWLLENATGINAGGEIVGAGTVDGAEHAFLLVPKSPRLPANN
jgi:probable HAF family extracellular repeat protein